MVWKTGKVKREFARGRLVGEIVKYKVENVAGALRPWTCRYGLDYYSPKVGIN